MLGFLIVAIASLLAQGGEAGGSCFECNVNYVGGDLKSVNEIGSLRVCQETCQTFGGCEGFTYVPQWNRCFLKSGSFYRESDAQKTLGYVSGPRTCGPLNDGMAGCIECNTDYGGNDLAAIYLSPWRASMTHEVRRLQQEKQFDELADITKRAAKKGDKKGTKGGKKGGKKGNKEGNKGGKKGGKKEGTKKGEKQPKTTKGGKTLRTGNKSANNQKKSEKIQKIRSLNDVFLKTPLPNQRQLAAYDYAGMMKIHEARKEERKVLANSSNESYSFQACVDKCEGNPKCTHCTFVPHWGGCFLKTGPPDPNTTFVQTNPNVSYSTLGFISTQKHCLTLPGDGGTSTTSTTATPSTTGSASTTVPPSTTPTTTTTPPPTTALPSTTAALPTITPPVGPLPCFLDGSDYFGNDLYSVGATSPEVCQMECSYVPECSVWTFVPIWFGGNNCYLKAEGASIVSNSQTVEFTAGPRECPLFPVGAPCKDGTYGLVRSYKGEEIFDEKNWIYFTDEDPTRGYVNYVDGKTAKARNYTRTDGDRALIYPDFTRVPGVFARGRDSVRITSRHSYNDGLWVFSINNMPTGCGTWPAYWLVGQDPWPLGGEVDIMEGANKQTLNHVALHTVEGCKMEESAKSLFSGEWCPGEVEGYGLDCYHLATTNNLGCCVDDVEPSFGVPLNEMGGGVFVAEVDLEKFVRVWFFRHEELPEDLTKTHPTTVNHPNPDTWTKKPLAHFPLDEVNCSGPDHFKDLRIVINQTFCGGYSGYTFLQSKGCPGNGIDDCEKYVRNNPSAFKDSYWDINWLGVYRRHFYDEKINGCRTASEEKLDGETSSRDPNFALGTETVIKANNLLFYYNSYLLLSGQGVENEGIVDPTPLVEEYLMANYAPPQPLEA